jgi:hypothetical protein
MLGMANRICVFCGKTVVPVPPGPEVREGEQLSHLDCYVLSKRQVRKP